MTGATVPTPIASKDVLYIFSGCETFHKKPIWAIKSGASGDITVSNKTKYILWYNEFDAPYVPTPVLYKDNLYVAIDQGKFICFNALTGEKNYTIARLSNQTITSSLCAYKDRIFCQTEGGNTFVIKHGNKYELEKINSIKKEWTLSTPIYDNTSLYLRGFNTLFCY
jgi:outer membrane protein assembly factor BamB